MESSRSRTSGTTPGTLPGSRAGSTPHSSPGPAARPPGRGRAARLAALAAAGLLSVVVPSAQAAAAPPAPRVDLTVLVVDDGGSAVEAITAELKASGVPYRTLDLADPARPVLTAAFLGDPADAVTGRPRARYQGVVLPHEAAFGPDSAEQAALVAYERTYGIPQVDASTWAHPGIGLDYTSDGGWSGVLDGVRARVTPAGQAGPFRDLRGTLVFEDNDPKVSESYGYAGRPRTGYTSYLDLPAPDGAGRVSLIGEYAHDGRRELVVTFAYDAHQRQFRALARGIVDWLTQGVHPGRSRNYLSVHVDDVLAPDARWDTARDCTPGDGDCPGGDGADTTPIRMTAADAAYAAAWQKSAGLVLDLVYNGGQGEQWKTEHGGTDPLAARLLADRDRYRWVNHTYTHPFLGCVQNTATVPWSCAKDARGAVKRTGRTEISAKIRDNLLWAYGGGVPVDATELVTGEHSGLKTLPQQPADNPNPAGALADNGVRWTASDNSREPGRRPVGSGYATRIAPQEARTALGHVMPNDPRPHYVHQSNLAEDRLLYPVLADYRELYADNTPLVDPRQQDVGTELSRRTSWDEALFAGRVTAYRVGPTVTVKAPADVAVPLTAPEGTRKQLLLGTAAFGTPYAGARSDWTTPELLQTGITLTLPAAPAA